MKSEKNIKPSRKQFTTDYTDYTDRKVICFFIRAIREIRGISLKFLCFHGVIFSVIFFISALTSFALDAPERAFIWNEANAQMQNARTQSDYLRAAQIYQRLIDDGVRNGPLFYNMGTALLLADRNELAFDAFERAERYLGRQTDIEHNLKIALAKKSKSKEAQIPWYRIVAFWHFYLSCPQRSGIAAFAFLFFWLALILRQLGIKRGLNAVSTFSLIVFVVFATSAAASWQMESAERRYNLSMPPAIAPTNSAVNPEIRK